MKSFKIDDKEYQFKQNLDDITVKEYFDIMKIVSERTEKPVPEEKKFKDGTYEKEYYLPSEEPDEIKLDKSYRIISILSGLEVQLFKDYPDLYNSLSPLIEDLTDDSPVWYSTIHKDRKYVRSQKKYLVEDSTTHQWVYDDVSKWTFQQWVDMENASRQNVIYPFLIAVYKVSITNRKKRAYDRSHPDFEDKEQYWYNQPARGNINTITHILDVMSETRKQFFWIYEATSQFTEPEKPTMKAYTEFAGWNDVIVSMSKNPTFNSSKGTLYGVRNAPCLEVLEYLNWERGKSFAEYEDYKLAEQNKKFQHAL